MRALEDWGDDAEEHDVARTRAMKKVNPNLVPRSWILDEEIRKVEKEGDREVLGRVVHPKLHPFEDNWAGRPFEGAKVYEGDEAEEVRWTGDAPATRRSMQCSCSSYMHETLLIDALLLVNTVESELRQGVTSCTVQDQGHEGHGHHRSCIY